MIKATPPKTPDSFRCHRYIQKKANNPNRGEKKSKTSPACGSGSKASSLPMIMQTPLAIDVKALKGNSFDTEISLLRNLCKLCPLGFDKSVKYGFLLILLL